MNAANDNFIYGRPRLRCGRVFVAVFIVGVAIGLFWGAL